MKLCSLVTRLVWVVGFLMLGCGSNPTNNSSNGFDVDPSINSAEDFENVREAVGNAQGSQFSGTYRILSNPSVRFSSEACRPIVRGLYGVNDSQATAILRDGGPFWLTGGIELSQTNGRVKWAWIEGFVANGNHDYGDTRTGAINNDGSLQVVFGQYPNEWTLVTGQVSGNRVNASILGEIATQSGSCEYRSNISAEKI